MLYEEKNHFMENTTFLMVNLDELPKIMMCIIVTNS